MRKVILVLAILGTGALVATAAENLVLSGDVLGANVIGQGNQDIGHVDELIMAPGSNEISYAVVSVGGVLGIGARLRPVPWDAVEIQHRDDELRVSVPYTKNQVDEATAFDYRNRPDLRNDQWMAQVDRHYGVERSERDYQRRLEARDRQWDQDGRDRRMTRQDMEQRQAHQQLTPEQRRQQQAAQEREQQQLTPEQRRQHQAARDGDRQEWDQDDRRTERRITRWQQARTRTSELIGTTIENPAGEDIANLDNLVMNSETGEIAYALVSFGGFWGMGTSTAAVPYEALRVTADERIVLSATREQLEQSAIEEPYATALRDLNRNELYSRFNVSPQQRTAQLRQQQQQQPAQR